jgi:heat shock protein HslJ
VAAGLLLAGCSGDDGATVQTGEDTPGASAEQLVRRDWDIVAVTAGDERRTVDDETEAVLRFDGEGAFSGTTCNHFGGDVTVTPSELEWGDEVMSTSMLCTDEDVAWLETHVLELFSGTATWSLADDVLRIEGNDVRLELRERADAFPTELVPLATSAPGAEAEWQFGYSETSADDMAEGSPRFSITWEGRTAPGTAYGSAGLAVDPSIPLEAMWVDGVDGRLFPFGTLPDGTVTAVFETADGTQEPITAYELPDGRRVYGQPVEATRGQVVALDAAGEELGRGRTVPAG